MTTEDIAELVPPSLRGPLSALNGFLRALAAVFVVIAGVYAAVTLVSGGFKLQTQVAVETLTISVDDLRKQVTVLAYKIEQMPRVADLASHNTHLLRLDQQVEAINDRLLRDELAAAKTLTWVEDLRAGKPPLAR